VELTNMKTIFRLLVGTLLGLVLVGCKSYGPAFDPYAGQPAPTSTGAPEGQARKLFATNRSSFVSVKLTNEIRPEWLQPSTNFFRLGPGDRVEIEASGEAGNRVSTTVGPDGKIYYSLLPGLDVWGRTLAETRDLIETNMAKFVRIKPDLVVTVASNASRRVWVLGNVPQPGLYPLSIPRTVLEVLTAAGGPFTTGSGVAAGAFGGAGDSGGIAAGSAGSTDLSQSFIMRKGDILKVDFRRLMNGGDLSQNIYLEPDDFIYIRPSTAKSVFVFGNVQRPVSVPYGEQLSLATVIANAGGPAPYGYLSHVIILRGSLTEPRAAVVDFSKITKGELPDVKLEPGDIVFLPESPYKDLEMFVTGIVSQFVRTIAINAGYHVVYPNATSPVGISVPGGAGSYIPVK